MPDFTITNGGSIYLLKPNSEAAKEWVTESISEDHIEFGGAIVVEHRYIWDIIEAIQTGGMEVM